MDFALQNGFRFRIITGAWILIIFFLFFQQTSLGQGVRVGPDGKTSQQKLNLPFVFYNESFGFSAAYVSGVVGYPQKQSTLLGTAMAGTQKSGGWRLNGVLAACIPI